MRSRLNLRQRILYDLGEKIVLGQYLPGSILPREQDLAAHYNVSRTVIREAVKGLAARGLLTSRPNVGATVNPRTEWQWIDSDVIAWALVNRENRADVLLTLYEAFAVVNPAVIEDVARHCTNDEMERIWAAYQCLEEAQGNVDDWDRAIDAWYTVLHGICRNSMLQSMVIRLSEVFKSNLRDLTATKLARSAPHIDLPWTHSSAEALRYHRHICQCIELHDSDMAFQVARRIFQAVLNNIRILRADPQVRQLIESAL